jgi:Xaa-Pro dipeptidase
LLVLNEKRANEFLEKFKLDVIISTSRENTTYLTNFLSVSHIQDKLYNVSPGGGENYLQIYGILPRGEKPVLVLPASLYKIAELDNALTDRIRVYGEPLSISPKMQGRSSLDDPQSFESPDQALVAAVKEFVPGKNCGIDYSDMDVKSLKALKGQQGIQTKNATELFRFIRAVKSQEEIRRLRSAGIVNEHGMNSAFAAVRSGAKGTEIMREYAKTIVSYGGKFDFGNVLLGVGAQGGEMVNPSRTRVRQGDAIWIDVITSLNGYSSDTGDSASVGKPSEKQLNIYNAMEHVIRKAEDLARAGAKPSDIYREALPLWDRFGLSRPQVTLAHGIGIETHEYPQISSRSLEENAIVIKDDFIHSSADIPLEAGMVLNIESAYLVPHWGGVHLERTIVIEKSRSRPLYNQKRSMRRPY